MRKYKFTLDIVFLLCSFSHLFLFEQILSKFNKFMINCIILRVILQKCVNSAKCIIKKYRILIDNNCAFFASAVSYSYQCTLINKIRKITKCIHVTHFLFKFIRKIIFLHLIYS